MLARPDGERRLTNLLHLGERLHDAAMAHPAPDALLRWLHAQRSEAQPEESAQLRLESDRNLVKIVTIHKAKGLEYPVVFCPFLWDGHRAPRNEWRDARAYHDREGIAVVDFRDERERGADGAWIEAQIKLEEMAETVRLLYVALTRASHRCYLVAGCYATRHGNALSTKQSSRSMLNWLAAGAGTSPQDWSDSAPPPAAIMQAWSALAARSGQGLALAPLPRDVPTPLGDALLAPESLVAARPPVRIPPAWRIGSYSALTFDATGDAAAIDHDLRVPPATIGAAPTDLPADDILGFPRGPLAGECLHAVLERIDFTDPSTWPDAIQKALAASPFAARAEASPLAAMIQRMLADVLATSLPDGLRLGDVPLDRRLTELEFALPSPRLSARALNATLAGHGYDVPRLAFADVEGYLKGFIDLVCQHGGRFYIVDWKSNHLGHARTDYDAAPVAAAMVEHGYHLQHLLYSLALHRYLARRLAGYAFDRHFGGVLYLFVRGVRPAWRMADGAPAGVYCHRLGAATLADLDRLFPGVGEACRS